MSELAALLDALDAIDARRDSSYVVVGIDGAEGLYAEFWADGPSGLAAELVGNDELPPDAQLSLADQRRLRDLGWDDETGMWRREWPAALDRDGRERVAYEALRALGEVYGATGAVRVAEIGLAGDDEAESPAAARTVLIVAAVVMLVGVALAVFLAGA